MASTNANGPLKIINEQDGSVEESWGKIGPQPNQYGKIGSGDGYYGLIGQQPAEYMKNSECDFDTTTNTVLPALTSSRIGEGVKGRGSAKTGRPATTPFLCELTRTTRT